MAYDAFISYSHGTDARLAPVLQASLHRFAKPWWKRRALHVFRDETSLAAAASLSGAILRALDEARYFILLASPRAAQSKWCRAEITHWLGRRSPETLLIVLTEGVIRWDDTLGDFEWTKTDALPAETLTGVFKSEPYYLDLTWAKSAEQFDAREPRFQSVVAKLAATLHGKSLEEISGEELRQHRRARRIAVGAIASIGMLAFGATAAAVVALQARRVAEISAAEARSQRNIAERARVEAERQRTAAEARLSAAIGAAETLVFDIAEDLKDFEGVPSSRMKQVLERAEQIFVQLESAGSTPLLRHRQAVMWTVLSSAYRKIGDSVSAMRKAEQARDALQGLLREVPTDLEVLRALSIAHDQVGDLLRLRRDEEGALVAYRESASIRQRLLAQEPDQERRLRDVAISHSKIGDALRALGQSLAAEKEYTAALGIAEKLSSRQLRDSGRLRAVAAAHQRIGDVRADRTDLKGALVAYLACQAAMSKAVEYQDTNTDHRHALSICHDKIAESYHRLGRAADAIEEYRKSLATIEILIRKNPSNTDWQRSAAVNKGKIGLMLLLNHSQPKEALAMFQAGQEIMARLSARDPQNLRWKQDLAMFERAIEMAKEALRKSATEQ